VSVVFAPKLLDQEGVWIAFAKVARARGIPVTAVDPN